MLLTYLMSITSSERFIDLSARISEFQPTKFHCQMMIVDSLTVSVGSTNRVQARCSSTT